MNISAWDKDSFFQKLDVLVLGGGLCGLWTAKHLIERFPHWKIAIADRAPSPWGASTRNAGFACFGSAGELYQDLMRMPENDVWKLVEMRFQGLNLLKSQLEASAIDYQEWGGYEIFTKDQSTEAEEVLDHLPKINAALKDITGKSELIQSQPPSAFSSPLKISQLLYNPLEGQLHSGKLVLSLQQSLLRQGVRWMGGLHADSWEKTEQDASSPSEGFLTHFNGLSPNDRLAKDQSGPSPYSLSIPSRYLVVCTNGFGAALLPELDVVPARGQVLLTKPLPQNPIQGCYHMEEGYYYFRNWGQRILIGGARNLDFQTETTTEIGLHLPIQNHLMETLKTLFPHLQPHLEMDQQWAGIMGMGSSKMPLVGETEEGVLYCLRMSGMGVALSPIVAQKIVHFLEQKQ